MSRRVLVTGGTGFLGRSLVRRLVQAGERVRVLDNDWRGAKEKLADLSRDVEIVTGDIRNYRAVLKACRKQDTVFHLAYVNGTRYFYEQPDLVLDVGVQGAINVCKAALEEGVPDLIAASSSEVYQNPPAVPTDESVPLVVPDPLNPRYSYGGGKILTELVTFNFGRDRFRRVMVFRPHNVFGPDMGWEHVIPQLSVRMRELALRRRGAISFPIQGTGKESRSFIYIDDFTAGLMAVYRKGKNRTIYHIGTMDVRTIGEIAKKVGDYYGRKVFLKPKTLRKGSTPRRCPDIARLKSLGFKPKWTFDAALNATLEWYDRHAGTIPQHVKKEIMSLV